MDKLDEALAELAKQLGVGVNELWSWFTDYGLQSYARYKVVFNAMACVTMLVACIVLLVIVWQCSKRHKDWQDDWDFGAVVCAIFAFGAFIAFASFLTEAVTWALEPQGKMIDMLASLG